MTITQQFPACGTCCDPCALGPTLEVLFSGLVLCDDCQAQGLNAPVSVLWTAISLSGPYTLTGPTTGPWVIASVGSWTANRYTSVSGFAPPCDTDHLDAEYSGTLNITISCAGDGQLTVFVSTNAVAGFDDGFGSPISGWAFLSTGPIDTAIANALACGAFNMTSGGTATVSTP